MIDRVEVYVKGGDGGDGEISFRREKFVPFGGPNGGNGGDGGNVYIAGDENLVLLQEFRYRKRFKAENGGRGKGKDMTGRRGEDLIVKVPLGTEVYRKQEDESELQIADIVEQGQSFLVARGGKGGYGNAHFATSTDQAPRIAENGKSGEEVRLVLNLKMIADVGIVGLPNAGKSTLLSKVTRARPKIADYPFTTTEPVIGVAYAGYNRYVVSEIPGIIEGASRGLGLGLDFLRHAERTKILIHLIDGGSVDPVADIKKLETELAQYSTELRDRPRIIAVNKIDLPEVHDRKSQLEEDIKLLDMPFFFISANTGEGVDALMSKAFESVLKIGKISSDTKPDAGYKVFRPHPLSTRAGAPTRRSSKKHD